MILITGGTGAFGAPLLEAFRRDDTPVLLLARAGVAAHSPSVRAIRGDILQGDALGMDVHTAALARDRVTAIVHAAALTRFDAPLDAARRVNVGGTRHVLEFASRCRSLQRFCALSTVYVAGRRTGVILESELEHACGFVNAYEESKYEAERLLREWMARLPITICRLSTILGDSTTGRVHRVAALHQSIRFLYHSLLPMIPGAADSPVDLIATDYAVAAIRHLAGPGFAPGRTVHVCAGCDAVPEAELIDLAIGAFLRYRPDWRRRTIERPAIVALETFNLFRESVEAVADPALLASVRVLGHFAPQLAFPKRFDDRGCQSALAGAGILRPPIRDTIGKVIEHLINSHWSVPADGDGAGTPG